MKRLALLTTASAIAFAGKTKPDPSPADIGAGASTTLPNPLPDAGTDTPAATTDEADKPKAERVAPVLTAAIALPLPAATTSNRGSKSAYDFAALEVGHAFGVKNKTKANLASIITNANKKYLEPKKDGNGAVVYKTTEMKDAAGNVTHVPSSDPETVQTRHFFAMDVNAEYREKIAGTPLEGSTVLVFRDK